MRLVSVVAAVEQDSLRLAFAGGTSLSKGFGLIKRFSEDLDFKVILPAKGVSRRARARYRRSIVQGIRTAGGWELNDDDIVAGNESRHFGCRLRYPTRFAAHAALRPHIRLEVTFASPALPVEDRSLRSFVAEARNDDAEVRRIACVAPVETAADKLSALTWRVLARRRGDEGDDATLIRHLHDLAALEPPAAAHERFPALASRVLRADANRGGVSPELAALPPTERFAAALKTLASDPDYPSEYERFVLAMSYADAGETPTFAAALESVRRLAQRLHETE